MKNKRLGGNRYEEETGQELPSWIDQLKKYETPTNNCKYWLHMSPLPKIGINPQQQYLCTPIGLYAHPIDEDLIFDLDPPTPRGYKPNEPNRMGHDREYGYVFTTKSGPGVVRINSSGGTSDYDEDEIERHLDAVRGYVGDDLYDEFFGEDNYYDALTFKNLYNCLKRFNLNKSSSDHFKWSQFMKNTLGIKVIEDPHGILIVLHEPQVLYLDLSFAKQVDVLHNSSSHPSRVHEDSLFFGSASTTSVFQNLDHKLSYPPSKYNTIAETLFGYKNFCSLGVIILRRCFDNSIDGIISPFDGKDKGLIVDWSYFADKHFGSQNSVSALIASKQLTETLASGDPKKIWDGFLSDVGIRRIADSKKLIYEYYMSLQKMYDKVSASAASFDTNLSQVCVEMDDGIFNIGASIEDGLIFLLSVYTELFNNMDEYYNNFGLYNTSTISRKFLSLRDDSPKDKHLSYLKLECEALIQMTEELLTSFENLN